METLNEVNELLTTRMCSPVIIFGIILVLSIICIYFVRQKLGRYNTLKMENLFNLYSAQELKYLLILGVTMYGLCQYNKTELAWVFLIFPVIYVIIQNVLLFIHVSSALQSAPSDPLVQADSYGLGMKAPLLPGAGPSPPAISTDEKPVPPPTQPKQDFTLPKMTSQSNQLGNAFNLGGSPEPTGFNL